MQDIPLVRDAMRTPVHCVHDDAPLLSAAALLADRSWSGAPVVDGKGKMVGLLSESDVVQALATAAFHNLPGQRTVADAMTFPVHTTTPEADLFSLVAELTHGPHRRVVVCDDDNRPVGMLTRKDLMRALHAQASVKVRIQPYDEWAKARGVHNPFHK